MNNIRVIAGERGDLQVTQQSKCQVLFQHTIQSLSVKMKEDMQSLQKIGLTITPSDECQ